MKSCSLKIVLYTISWLTSNFCFIIIIVAIIVTIIIIIIIIIIISWLVKKTKEQKWY